MGDLGSLGEAVGRLGVPWGAPLERPMSTLTPFFQGKHDAHNNQEIDEGNVIQSPKIILADSCNEINGFKKPTGVPGRPQTSFWHTVVPKSIVSREGWGAIRS